MFKNVDIWIGNYIRQNIRPKRQAQERPIHILFSFVDHFEPDWNMADARRQSQRVKRWVEDYPALAERHRDGDGCHPRHSFFYPAEVYVPEHLEQLSGLCRQGLGEVEVHLHHNEDTDQGFRAKLEQAKEDFSRHGLLGQDKANGELRFGFIHGNWALNNSHPDGHWCGVNNESRILAKAGCYADFTMPSAPSATQTRKINSIYYDAGNPDQPKSHDRGEDAAVGKADGNGLMMVQGPLALNWHSRKWGLLPRIENGDVNAANPPSPDRVDLWVNQQISVAGRPDWIFVKVHTHGAVEKNADVLLGEPMDRMWAHLEERYNDGKNFILHYVSVREMYNIIKAAEAGETGNPREYRDYRIVKNF